MQAAASRSALSLRSSSRLSKLLAHGRSPSFCPPWPSSPATVAPLSTYIPLRARTSPSPPASLSRRPRLPQLAQLPSPLQHTSRHPMSFFSRFFYTPKPEDVMAAEQKAQKLIDENPVVVFSKSYCPYCRSTKRTLDGLGAKYLTIELNQENDGREMQDALAKMTGQHTVPNIYIGQEHIGGNSDLEAHKNTDLTALLKKAGALA